MREKLKAWFLNNVNWCHGYYYNQFDSEGNPVAKPENKVYEFFYRHWLWPWKQNECLCCNTVRGLMYGFIIGAVVGGIIC